MATVVESSQINPSQISHVTYQILDHVLDQLDRTPTCDEPYSHFYLDSVFPDDVYAEMMAAMPAPHDYRPLSLKKHQNADGVSTRDVLPLNSEGLSRLPQQQRELWEGVAAALTAPELKVAVFRKLATDLSHRFNCRPDEVEQIVSYTRPSLFRDLEGYEIAPHPDGRAKIVTMQLYIPANRTQLHLGTAVYKRRFKSLQGLYSWHGRFDKVKQFLFQPNSGYAFAVSNSLGKKSWHGREQIPPGSGVRNSILNIFFADPGRTY
jgi:hypothetical protein